MLYDFVQCPHRVTMDLFGDPAERDEPSPFMQLLWEKGYLFEKEVMSGTGEPFLDLSRFSLDEKEQLTTEAMERGEPLIYGGRISADDLLGDPDLLRRQGDGYVAGDIKSGRGTEGDDEDLGKPKKHYGVQMALYTDILERKGISAGRVPFIWDINGDEVIYDLDAPMGPKTPQSLWELYQSCLAKAQAIVASAADTLPAYGGVCKECHWYTACQGRLKELDDLTLLPGLGRSRRDAMHDHLATRVDLAEINVDAFIQGKKTVFRGIGPASLMKFHDRAKLIKSPDPQPYLTEPVQFPVSDLEIFFDIEVDPMRDICYLHGFVERHGGKDDTESYVWFFTDDENEDEERRAFADAWQYLQERTHGVIYYYSKYERTIWRKLREKYPDVCSGDELEALFDPARAIDLYYDVVVRKTEWPTHDHSIKTLAKHLGFQWRDAHPSGAASIEWFDRWVRTRDQTIKQRILEYNEDDCRATRVLLDGIRGLALVDA
jgi:predicted RecB family nuclease